MIVMMVVSDLKLKNQYCNNRKIKKFMKKYYLPFEHKEASSKRICDWFVIPLNEFVRLWPGDRCEHTLSLRTRYEDPLMRYEECSTSDFVTPFNRCLLPNSSPVVVDVDNRLYFDRCRSMGGECEWPCPPRLPCECPWPPCEWPCDEQQDPCRIKAILKHISLIQINQIKTILLT